MIRFRLCEAIAFNGLVRANVQTNNDGGDPDTTSCQLVVVTSPPTFAAETTTTTLTNTIQQTYTLPCDVDLCSMFAIFSKEDRKRTGSYSGYEIVYDLPSANAQEASDNHRKFFFSWFCLDVFW
jgi:hypothetical protein